MAGELVPLVLIPRYTSYNGATDFTTIGMEVTDYEKALVNVWRGPLAGGGTFLVTFQESTDGTNWTTCGGTTPGDPGSETETQYQPELTKRWFRVKITMTGTAPAVSCWALGFLQMRES
jgi:hypothetical protein